MADPQYRGEHLRRRRAWQTAIQAAGGEQCHCVDACRHHAGRCPVVIRPGDAWDLSHHVAVIHGGDGTDSAPRCARCNRSEGADIGNARRLQPASRNW